MTQPNSSEPYRIVKNHANYDDIRSLAIPSQVVVTSQSNFKLEAVRNVLGDVWPDRNFDVQGVKVPSGVSEQPLGRETVQGALNRLNAAKIECQQRGAHMTKMAFFLPNNDAISFHAPQANNSHSASSRRIDHDPPGRSNVAPNSTD